MRTLIPLLVFLLLTSLSSRAQYYFYDVCQDPSNQLTLDNGITVTCGYIEVGTGDIHIETGTRDVQYDLRGTTIRVEDDRTIRDNGPGWTNYMGLTLNFDSPILPIDSFFIQDLDEGEQMTVFGYNRQTNQWVFPQITLGENGLTQNLQNESVINDFPLPPGAPSFSGNGILIPTVNTTIPNNQQQLWRPDLAFYPDFGSQGVTDLYFLYGKELDPLFYGTRSVLIAPDFELLENVPSADLEVTKQASSTLANPGSTVTFTITVTNNGPDATSDVWATDLLPNGYSYVSHSESAGTYNPVDGHWTSIGTIDADESEVLEIDAIFNATGNHENKVRIRESTLPDPDSDPNEGYDVDDLGDGLPDDDEDSVSIELNLPPIAEADTIETPMSTPVTISVSTNDSDVNNNLDLGSINTNCAGCTPPSNGGLTNLGNGNFSYSPTGFFTGQDQFTYQICDQLGLCDLATVIINVIWDPACADFCEASITASTMELCLGGSIVFDGSSSLACDPIPVSSWDWDFGDGNTGTLASNTYTYTTPGSYNVILTIGTDSMCSDQMMMNIDVFAPPTVQLTLPVQSCIYDEITLTGGTPSGGTYSGPGVSSSVFDASQAGLGTHLIYYNYTDGNGCSGVDSAFISVFDAPQASLEPVNDMCVADNAIALPNGSPLGGVYDGTGVANSDIDPAVLGEGSFYIDYIYTNNDGCVDTATSTFSILDIERDTTDAVLCDGDDYTLPGGDIVTQPGAYVDTNLAYGQCGIIEYTNITLSYNTIDTLHVGCRDTTDYIPTFAVPFTVSTVVQNDLNLYGCDSVTVFLVYEGVGLCPEDCKLFIPSAFSPNRDGLNDFFYPISNCPNILISYEMDIYNRWGETVYTTKDYNVWWDGTFKGQDTPIDVFTYIIKYDHTLGEQMKSGPISVIR